MASGSARSRARSWRTSPCHDSPDSTSAPSSSAASSAGPARPPRSPCTDEDAMLNAAGRVVMVSGANRGIGRAIAEALYADGYTVSLGGRDRRALEAVARGWDPARVHVGLYDARAWPTHAAWVGEVAERFGRIDGLVNNAG